MWTVSANAPASTHAHLFLSLETHSFRDGAKHELHVYRDAHNVSSTALLATQCTRTSTLSSISDRWLIQVTTRRRKDSRRSSSPYPATSESSRSHSYQATPPQRQLYTPFASHSPCSSRTRTSTCRRSCRRTFSEVLQRLSPTVLILNLGVV